MAIARTNAHRKRMIEEAAQGVINLQQSIASNAAAHRKWAVDQSVPLSELQTMISDTINAYEAIRAKLRHFRDVTIPADAGFTLVGDQFLLTLQSVGSVGQAVADDIDVFSAMPRATYAEIIAACDYLIANVNPPESVWD